MAEGLYTCIVDQAAHTMAGDVGVVNRNLLSARAGEKAGVAEENSRHALETAQKLSHQLRAAEDRMAELEAEVTAYQERANRAEQWLYRVYTEIEDRFLQQSDGRGAMNGAPQRLQNARRSR
jgi:hypothetical protein